jgi:hypothetical protein
MRLWLFFLFCTFSLHAEEIEALYLSWYDDPTTTLTVQWHTPLSSTEGLSKNKMNYFDSARQSQIEGFRSERGDLSPCGKDDEEDRFGKVAASQNGLDSCLTVPETPFYLEMPDGTWRPFPAKTHPMLGAPVAIHTVMLEHLASDTLYRFRIGAEEHSFRTAPSSLAKPLRFVVGGDLYLSAKIFRAMSKEIVKQEPLFAVLGGDLAYALSARPSWLTAAPVTKWRRFLADWTRSMRTPDGRLIPFLIAPGNHDIAPHDYELFFNLFAFPQKRLYRAVDFSDYLSLVLLDTGHLHPVEGIQTKWLKEALASRVTTPFLLAVYHKGAYPSFYSAQDPIVEAIRAHWCPLFDEFHLQAAFEHHSHTFKKSYPLKQNQVQSSGTLYFGDGCWGVPPRIPQKRWYLEKEARKNHVYLVELSSKAASIKAIGLKGSVLDETVIPIKN